MDFTPSSVDLVPSPSTKNILQPNKLNTIYKHDKTDIIIFFFKSHGCRANGNNLRKHNKIFPLYCDPHKTRLIA